MKETGQEYLLLNRGVNSVVNINLEEVVSQIDFNSNDIQVYPGSKGKITLREAINREYFDNKALVDNILITGGGISGLDICLQNLEIDEVLFPPFFWGTYTQLCNLRKVPYDSYPNYDYLISNASEIKGKAVIICDPGNPLGEKYPDEKLYQIVKTLDKHEVPVIFDSPYRRLFYDHSDTFYQELLALEHVIIVESFSKSLGLSGQRIGFIYNSNKAFMEEAALRISFATNGINSFAQTLVLNLLDSEAGKSAVVQFKKATLDHISRNIKYLKDSGLLATNLYAESEPVGIFAVVNRSTEELFAHRIGSVGLDYFVKAPFPGMENLSRILVSYPHEKFVSFFRTLQ